MPQWFWWLIGVIGSFFSGATVLAIACFYLAINFNPLVISMDFGVPHQVYGVFGEFGSTQTTQRGSEIANLIYYQNIAFIGGFSKASDASGRTWQLAGPGPVLTSSKRFWTPKRNRMSTSVTSSRTIRMA